MYKMGATLVHGEAQVSTTSAPLHIIRHSQVMVIVKPSQ